MILRFKTKTDRCGNTYGLILDTDKKTFSTNGWIYKDDVIITRRKRSELIEQAKADGYKEN